MSKKTAILFRPHDDYHPYSLDSWDSTEFEGSASESEILVRESASRQFFLLPFPPSEDQRRQIIELTIGGFISTLPELRSTLPRHMRNILTPTPAEQGKLPSPTKESSKRFRDHNKESSDSEGGEARPPPKKPCRTVLAPITNGEPGSQTVATLVPSTAPLPSPAQIPIVPPVPIASFPILVAPPPAPAVRPPTPIAHHPTPLAPSPSPIALPPAAAPAAATTKRHRRTAEEVRNAGRTVTTDNSYVCKIDECQISLLAEEAAEAREHLKTHFEPLFAKAGKSKPAKGSNSKPAKGPKSKSVQSVQRTCPRCSTTAKSVQELIRHFVKHLPWEFPCVACGKTFSRLDAQKRHRDVCRKLRKWLTINGKPMPFQN